MKKLLALLPLLFAVSCFSQSFFKPLPKVKSPQVQARKVTRAFIQPDQPLPVPLVDSQVNAIRPIANLIAYAEPGHILMAGVGLSYQHLSWSVANQKWRCSWSISGMGWAGGSVAPKTPTEAVSYGIMAGFLNNMVMFGPAFNGKT